MSFALDLCACKRGFFTLRDCANAATASCTVCTRRICPDHMTAAGVCVECAAKRDEDAALTDEATSYAVLARHRWYRSGGYSPVYWGTTDNREIVTKEDPKTLSNLDAKARLAELRGLLNNGAEIPQNGEVAL